MPRPGAVQEARIRQIRELAAKLDGYAEPVGRVAIALSLRVGNSAADHVGQPGRGPGRHFEGAEAPIAWQGPSADRFVRDVAAWQVKTAGLARDLNEMAVRLRRVADQFEHQLPV